MSDISAFECPMLPRNVSMFPVFHNGDKMIYKTSNHPLIHHSGKDRWSLTHTGNAVCAACDHRCNKVTCGVVFLCMELSKLNKGHHTQFLLIHVCLQITCQSSSSRTTLQKEERRLISSSNMECIESWSFVLV